MHNAGSTASAGAWVRGAFDDYQYRPTSGKAGTSQGARATEGAKQAEDSPIPDPGARKRKRVLDSDSDDEAKPAETIGQALSALHRRQQAQRQPVLDDEGTALEGGGGPAPDVVKDTDDEEEAPVQGRPSMRVDLRSPDAKVVHAPTLLEVESDDWDKDPDAPDALLATCEEIASRLRSVLGDAKRNGQAEDGAAPLSRVTREQLKQACGEKAGYLKSYQIEGINFLMLLNNQGLEGSILADEMGLGKTCQLISYLGALHSHPSRKGRPHLVIAPASVLQNWQRELAFWCPSLRVVAYHGAQRHEERARLKAWQGSRGDAADDSASESDASDGMGEEWQEERHDDSADAHADDKEPAVSSQAPFDVMLACYTLFEKDNADQRIDRSFLRSWPWSHLVLDEAHAVKNRAAGRSRRLQMLAEGCQRRVMLTGTPLQNDLGELHSLMQFLLPTVFKGERGLEEAQSEEEEAALVERMKRILAPFVLRRLKSEVATQLAAKQQEVREVEMVPEQAQLYAESVKRLRREVAERRAANAAASTSGKALTKQLGTKRVGNMFVHLRKIAMHPLLVRNLYSDTRLKEFVKLLHRRATFGGSASEQRVWEEVEGYSDFELHQLATSHPVFKDFLLEDDRAMQAGKCRCLAELLPALQAKGSRPLIFSQWTQVLDVLEWVLQHLQLPFSRLDGSTTVGDRQTIVDNFNTKPDKIFAMLMTTRAGGQGLNLTGADTVILYDMDFNPQIDKQAEDRCHRLGQTKPVTVYRLVSKGTVDEGIYALAQRKLRLDAAVMGALTTGKAAGSKEETGAMGDLLAELLGGPDKNPEPQPQINSANDSGADGDSTGPVTNLVSPAPAKRAEVIELD
ncbi:hypothetical protein WJX73_008229 [Symbiochloris irregularis]|uniref:Uncharacterized protein n=1 Tax=Symbiochloris irregularis TaxID=706552 RepID=A0AAW1PQL4_9CHLO